jgi:predicted nucleic acid-binding Zn ribbon protein
MNPKEVEVCPECGSTSKRVFSAPAQTILKGAGFHEIDYPKNKVNQSKLD